MGKSRQFQVKSHIRALMYVILNVRKEPSKHTLVRIENKYKEKPNKRYGPPALFQ